MYSQEEETEMILIYRELDLMIEFVFLWITLLC